MILSISWSIAYELAPGPSYSYSKRALTVWPLPNLWRRSANPVRIAQRAGPTAGMFENLSVWVCSALFLELRTGRNPPAILRVMYIHAREIIQNSNRADLPIKYALAKAWANGKDDSYQKRAYEAHIYAFNRFYEESPRKIGREDFLSSFRLLFASISREGFLVGSRPLEINQNGNPTDGSHRIAVCAALGLKIPTKYSPSSDGDYDFSFFRARGLSEFFLDFSARERLSVDSSARIFVLHSNTSSREAQYFERLVRQKGGKVFHRKDLKLNSKQYRNFKRITYWDPLGESWVGKAKSGFAGAAKHAKLSAGSDPVKIYGISGMSPEDLLSLKQTFREKTGLGNYSSHSTDSHEETVEFGHAVFNPRLKEYLSLIPSSDLPEIIAQKLFDARVPTLGSTVFPGSFIIGGGSALAAMGLRSTSDIDIYVEDGVHALGAIDGLDLHTAAGDYFPLEIDQALTDPAYHFVLYGWPFANRTFMFRYKLLRREWPKDFVDLLLLLVHKLRFSALVSSTSSQTVVAFLIRRKKLWNPLKERIDRLYLLVLRPLRKPHGVPGKKLCPEPARRETPER